MGNVFGFLTETPEQALLKACKGNDVPGAKQALRKMFPNGERDTMGRLDGIKDEEGKNPLMVTARYGSIDCMNLLLQQGASADSRHFMQSSTALHYAAGWGQVLAVTALLDAGADPTAVNAQGFTPTDMARLHKHAQAVRALERRTSVFFGWLKWERSTVIQAGLGKVLGAGFKEAMRGKFGGEWRDCWAVITKLTGKASNIMLCPKCHGQFSDGREPGTKIACPHCRSDLHIPHTALVTILELAVYDSPQSARPEITFPLSIVSVENEFRVPDMNLWAARVYVQRPRDTSGSPSGGAKGDRSSTTPGVSPNLGLVDDSGKNPLWGQSALTLRVNDKGPIKKVVFGVNGDDPAARQHLTRFIDALRTPPMNALYFTSQSRAQGGMDGVSLAPAMAPMQSTMAVRKPAAPLPQQQQAPMPTGLTGARAGNNTNNTYVQVPLHSTAWTCPVCTLRNEADALRCEACDTPVDASPLEVARFRNTQQPQTAASSSSQPPAKTIVPVSATPPAPPPRNRPGTTVAQATVVEPPPLEEIEVIDPDEIPAHFICPLTHQVMDDPVVTVDGMSYERNAILSHFRERGAIAPITAEPLESTTISPNLALRRAIQEWRSSIPVASIAVV